LEIQAPPSAGRGGIWRKNAAFGGKKWRFFRFFDEFCEKKGFFVQNTSAIAFFPLP
jgi:hypothetical protein